MCRTASDRVASVGRARSAVSPNSELTREYDKSQVQVRRTFHCIRYVWPRPRLSPQWRHVALCHNTLGVMAGVGEEHL